MREYASRSKDQRQAFHGLNVVLSPSGDRDLTKETKKIKEMKMDRAKGRETLAVQSRRAGREGGLDELGELDEPS